MAQGGIPDDLLPVKQAISDKRDPQPCLVEAVELKALRRGRVCPTVPRR